LKKIVLVLCLVLDWAYGVENYTPVQEIVVDGMAKDMVVRGEKVYIGTDRGKLQVYDYTAKKFAKEIVLPKIKDFMGDIVPARVQSVDYLDGRYLILSDSGKGGYSNLWIHENNNTIQLLGPEAKEAIVKARFVDKEHILLGYLSDEAALFNTKTKKERYRMQLSESKFSDFALNEKRTEAVFSCESGVLNIVDTQTGKIIKELKGINLDNVYKVDFKQNIISGAGQDRRGSIYDARTGKGDYIEGNFLIYATALSPSAKKVAFAMDEQNNISVYKVSTKSKIAVLKGQKSTLNVIVFRDETTLFSASNDDTVMMWKIK
jgi:WD40 repeat protein